MDDDEALVTALREAVALLEEHGVDRWARWLAGDLTTVERGDARGLDHLLGAFGGMGSINDLVVSPANGHRIAADQQAAVNARLTRLLGEAYRAASGLRHDLRRT